MGLGRRRFLGVTALGLAHGGCAAPRPGPRRHVLPDVPGEPGASTVAVVRPEAFPGHGAAVAAAIQLAGGLGFVKPGQSVLLKPALNSGNPYPATTDPETVHAVGQLIQQAGGRPFVADRTMFLRSTHAAFRKTRILDAARALRIPCLALEDEEVVALSHPLALGWGGTLRVYRPAAEADHLVSLCTPRTHRLGDFTMSMKNLVGVVDGSARLGMHLGPAFKDRLAEISLVARPSLVVMDGRMGFADGGPDRGDLCRPGFLAVGSDPLAVDAVGLAFLRLAGANQRISTGSIWSLPVMRRAARIGVGASSADRIHLAGLDAQTEARVRGQLG